MRKFFYTVLLLALIPVTVAGQRITQKMGRGVVAVNRTEGSIRFNKGSYLISWRRYAQEPEDTKYRVYKNGTLLTETTNTNFKPSALSDGDVITVNPVYGGEENADEGGCFKYDNGKTKYANAFMNIDFETEVCPANDYRTPFVFPADLNGDGVPDYVVVRSTAVSGVYDKAQAYLADGTYLWTYDFGPNIDPVAGQNSLITAYDINLDGKAEVIVKSSDGSRFWDKASGTWGLYANGKSDPDTDADGIVDYTKQGKRNAPWYMSVINGETGAEMDCAELNYTEAHDGTDQYGRDNRSDYMDDSNGKEYAFMTGHIIVTYDDGVHPMVMAECLDRTNDKVHHNYVFGFSYDWNGSKSSNWHHSYTWSRNDKTPWPAEFHQLRAADVDGDGRDEMLQGGYGVNTVKDMVFSAGIGHGDRFRVSDLDPTRPGMEVYAIQQSNLLGQVVYDAATGTHIKDWYLASVYDVARGECMDIDSTHLGYELYSLMPNLYDIKGNVIRSGENPFPYEGIWWDGDLGREKLGSAGGSGFDTNAHIEKDYGSRLAEFSRETSWAVHSGWANRAGFWGDLVGDWREEVILMKQNSANGATGIVGFTTDMYTDKSMYSLMEDPHYLLDCTSRGYYQSPNTSFYLGYQMKRPPLPGTMKADVRWGEGSEWNTSAANFKSFDLGTSLSFKNGESVMFDISGDSTQVIALNSTVEPSATYFMIPKEHSYSISGTGTIAGSGDVWKSERGTLNYNANISTTGKTVVSNGILNVNGVISGPLSLRALGTLAGNAVLNGDVDFEGSHNSEGCRLMPSEVITFGRSLAIDHVVYDEVTIADGNVGKIMVIGDVNITDTLFFTINSSSDDNACLKGTYTLLEATGEIKGEAALLKIRGLEGQPYSLRVDGNKIVLDIPETGGPVENMVWTGSETGEWDYSTKNFLDGENPVLFVKNSSVVFNDNASVKDVTLSRKMVQNGILFDNEEDFTLSGTGAISGQGGLTKSGNGELVMNLSNNDYTGATVINGGTLTIKKLDNGGVASSLGAATSDKGNLQINNARLRINADNVATDRNIQISDSAVIDVALADGSVSLNAPVSGSDGILVKEGKGQLNFNYAGNNPIKGLVLKAGTIAQGDKAATLGTVPFTIVGKDTYVNLIENKTMDNAPAYRHPTCIEEGAGLTLNGIYRGSVQGKFTGTGSLKIIGGQVRFDIKSDFSGFEGDLTLQNEVRFDPSMYNFKNTDVHLAEAGNIKYYNFGSGNTPSTVPVLQLGNLSDLKEGTAVNTTLSGATIEVGYLNEDAVFSEKMTASKMVKVGTGEWFVRSANNTSAFYVNGGTLKYLNFSGSEFTNGNIVVNSGAVLKGYGYTNSLTVRKCGVATSELTVEGSVGTLKVKGNMVLDEGATLLVKVSSAGNDRFQVDGSVSMAGNDTIKIMPLGGRMFAEGDKITVFTAGTPSSNWIVVSSDGSVWDDSLLASDGILMCSGATGTISGISEISLGSSDAVDVFTLDGRLLRHHVSYSEAMYSLPSGTYLVNGRKIVKK